MIKPEISNGILTLHVEGADKIWALKSQLTIPLEHITAVRLDSDMVKQWWHGMKMGGSNIPRVLTAGTFYQSGKRVFWDIHHPEKAVVISLKDETYNELVIEVEQPELFTQQLSQALKR